jgi:hypothetical protein
MSAHKWWVSLGILSYGWHWINAAMAELAAAAAAGWLVVRST